MIPGEEDPLEKLMRMKAQPSEQDPTDPLARLIALNRRHQPGHSKFTPEQLIARADRAVAQAKDEEAAEPTYGAKVAGGIASFLRRTPAEPLQVAARAAWKRQPYEEAYRDIRGGEDVAPAPVRVANSVLGNTMGAVAMPGGAVMQGARYGALSGATTADPSLTMKDRVYGSAIEGAFGAGAGFVGDRIVKAGRLATAKPIDEVMLRRQATMRADDAVNYGRAAREGDAAAPHSILALRKPDIAETADAVRNSRQFAGANDAKILRETFPRLSEQQGGLTQTIANSARARPTLSGESAEIQLMKDELLNAADPIMPSYRGAVVRHAEHARGMDRVTEGSDVADRIIKNTAPSAKQIRTNPDISPAGFRESIKTMDAAEAQAATEGLLGEASGKSLRATGNPFTAFGLGSSGWNTAMHVNRLAPFLDALDARAVDPQLLATLRAKGLPVNAEFAGRRSLRPLARALSVEEGSERPAELLRALRGGRQ